MNSIKVMSFNLRIASLSDGINYFDNRKKAIEEMIKNETPDLIGFQEAVSSSAEWLQATFGDRYVIIGSGRNANYDGESCPVAFRKDKFGLISFETLWLSDTPTVPGSFYLHSDQSRHPRIMHKALLKIKCTGQIIFFINTHLDHKGERARQLELEQLYLHIQSASSSGFLTGDFNALPDSKEISLFCEKVGELGWRDATSEVGGTFHGFGSVNPSKIDYIFTNAQVSEAYAVPAALGGVYLSDHVPVCTIESID